MNKKAIKLTLAIVISISILAGCASNNTGGTVGSTSGNQTTESQASGSQTTEQAAPQEDVNAFDIYHEVLDANKDKITEYQGRAISYADVNGDQIDELFFIQAENSEFIDGKMRIFTIVGNEAKELWLETPYDEGAYLYEGGVFREMAVGAGPALYVIYTSKSGDAFYISHTASNMRGRTYINVKYSLDDSGQVTLIDKALAFGKVNDDQTALEGWYFYNGDEVISVEEGMELFDQRISDMGTVIIDRTNGSYAWVPNDGAELAPDGTPVKTYTIGPSKAMSPDEVLAYLG